MKRGRTGWKQWMRLTIALASFASAPLLYSSCGAGGGGGGGTQSTQSSGTVVIAGGSIGAPASAQPAQPSGATPDGVTLTIQDAQISLDGDTYTSTIQLDSTTGGVVDVVATPGTPLAIFAESANDIPSGDYKAIRLTITNVSWHATWNPTNPSPCDGSTSGTAGGSVDLSISADPNGNSIFYFKSPDLGGNTLTYYQTAPNIPVPPAYVGDADHPFILASPVKVVGGTTTANLILGIGNTLTCNALSIFDQTGHLLRTISGDATGDKTGLNNPVGVYVDTTNNEIGVANSGNNSITIYDRPTTTGNFNLSPEPTDTTKPTVIGTATGLSSPAGIYVDTTNNEIGVANSGNDSITIYDRNTILNPDSSGNVLTKRPSISGYFTGLSKPMGIYAYTVNNFDEISVANNGNNSITTYNRLDTQDTAPLRIIGFQISTKLTAGISATDTTIPVSSITGFPASGVIQIENEELSYTGVTSNSFTGAARGLSGTTPAAHPNGAPVVGGGLTGLNRPKGLYVDTVNNELGVANSGNNSVTIYQRNVIGVSKPYSDPTSPLGVTPPKTFTIDLAETPDNPDITVPIDTGDNTTTLAGLVAYINDRAASLKIPITASINTDTAVQPFRFSRLVLASDFTVTVGGTLFADVPDFFTLGNSNFPPRYSISGPSTGLSGPSGVSVTNNEIIVTNSGNNSITVYSRADVVASTDGNVAPITTITSSALHSPMGLYLDAANHEIGVAHRGQQVVMALLPSIFPSSTNASSSQLSGNYNLIFYGAEMDHTTPSGIPISRFFAERASNANFTPGAAPSPTFNFTLDTKITRRTGDSRGNFMGTTPTATNCDPDNSDSGVIKSGTYGVNSDGSFYAMIEGDNGTLQGIVQTDGSTFAATMYDSPNKLMLVYGVKNPPATITQPPVLTSDYLFASYRTVETYNDQFDPGNPQGRYLDLLQNQLFVGIAATTPTQFTGVSRDANFVTMLNSTGLFADPDSTGSVYRQDFVGLQSQGYSTDNNGLLNNLSDGLSGALTSDGSTMIAVRNTRGCDDLGFEIGLRADRAKSFNSKASLKGSYSITAFGDLYPYISLISNTAIKTSLSQSAGGTITFDGAGQATLTLAENKGGILSSFNQSNFTYRVSPRLIPTKGSPAKTVHVVDLVPLNTPDTPYASALIGPHGQSLIFYSFLGTSGGANPTRLLGLAIRQTPP